MDFYTIMQQLNLDNVPNWTVSTLQKAPIAPKPALEAHFNPETFHEWFGYAKDPENSLVTLKELYQEPNTPKDKLALRVNIDKQHIMLVDMERDYDPKVRKYLKHLPAIYGERSRHGGLHYIVPVPKAILNDPKYQKLFMRTQVKFGTEDTEHSGVEIFFHNHYLTFTQNQVATKNNNTDDDLRYVLDYIQDGLKTTAVNNQTFIDNKAAIPTDALVIAEHALTDKSKAQIKRYIDKNDTADISDREYKNIFIIATHIFQTKHHHYALNPFRPGELIDPKSPEDPKMLTWALLHLTYQFLPQREKWNKISSQNQTYIQLSCNKAINYCIEKNIH